jgi:hypothetical protein
MPVMEVAHVGMSVHEPLVAVNVCAVGVEFSAHGSPFVYEQ